MTKPTGTLSQPQLVQGSPPISYGDLITFTATTENVSGLVEINLRAFQGGVIVSSAWFRPGMDTGLYSPVWQSGAATCVADLGWFDKQSRFHVLDSQSFDVAA